MKKILNIIMSLSVVGSLMSAIPAYASNTMKIHLNGKEVNFNVDPIVTNNTTMVEFRPLFEAMGLQVVWTADNPTQIIGKKDGLEITLHIGSKITMVNGKEVDLAVTPQVLNNHTLVPLRFVGEASGKDVKWTGGTDVQINDAMVSSGTNNNNGMSNTSSSDGSTGSNSDVGKATPPPYALKDLQVYWNGNAMVDRGHNVTAFYSPKEGKWDVYFNVFFSSLAGTGNLSAHRNADKTFNLSAKFRGNIYDFNDNDGVYVNGNKICNLKLIDDGATTLDNYSKALNFTYTVNENGVYITSK